MRGVTWVTSDYHFNHRNIIKYCKRPFNNIYEMNDTIISRHNEIVRPGDTVFLLGDFALDGSLDEFLSQMNGNFIFIRGNHDSGCKYFTTRSLSIRYNGKSILLLHDPEYVKKPQFTNKEYDIYLCGHVHEKWESAFVDNKHFRNIGVDVNNFYPVNLGVEILPQSS